MVHSLAPEPLWRNGQRQALLLAWDTGRGMPGLCSWIRTPRVTGIALGYEAQSTGRVLTDGVDVAVAQLIRGGIAAQPN